MILGVGAPAALHADSVAANVRATVNTPMNCLDLI